MRILLGAGALAAVAWTGAPSYAQSYPAKPVHMVVGFSAGSTTDLIGRVLATRMGDGLGQPVVMEEAQHALEVGRETRKPVAAAGSQQCARLGGRHVWVGLIVA